MKPVSLEDMIRGGLYGVAVGDALGATVEFMSRDKIREKYGELRDIVGGVLAVLPLHRPAGR